MAVSRREYLQVGAASTVAYLGIGGSRQPREREFVPDFRVTLGESVVAETTPTQRNLIHTRLPQYIQQAVREQYGAVAIEIEDRPDFSVEGNNNEELLSSFNDEVTERQAVRSHVLLLGQKDGLTSGKGDIPSCTGFSRGAAQSIVTGGAQLWLQASQPVRPSVPLWTQEYNPYSKSDRVLVTVTHEIGHNLCLDHGAGDAWYGVDAPSRYDPVRDTDTIYVSPMLAGYYLRHRDSVDSVDWSALPEFTGEETIRFGTLFAPEVLG